MRLLTRWRRFRYLARKYPQADLGELWRSAGRGPGFGSVRR